jgi:hypothetical protein
VSECPRCGVGVAEGQEYCLECGARLPTAGVFSRGAGSSRRSWLLRASLALVVALAGAAAAVAATEGGRDSAEVVTATGGFVTPATTSTLPPPAEGPAGIVEWPAGEEGWTIVMASVPQTEGRRLAIARTRQARRRGLSPVGILDSSRYASLHPGYWVVFTGIYGSEAEATSEVQAARRVSRTASVRRIVP